MDKTKPAPPSGLVARAYALIRGVFASGVEMTAQEQTQLKAAEEALKQDGDALALSADALPTEETVATTPATPIAEENTAEASTDTQIAALQSQIAALQSQVTVQASDTATSLLTQWASEGYVTPAAQDQARTLLQHSDSTVREAFQSFVASNGVHVAFKGNDAEQKTVPAATAAAVLAESNDATNATLHTLAIAKIKADKGDEKDFRVYQSALNAVAKANPSLVEANREAVPSL